MRPTRPFARIESGSRWRELPRDVTVLGQVDAARAAGLSFVADASAAWGRLELARWLVSEYRPSVAVLRSDARSRVGLSSSSPNQLCDEVVGRIVERARTRVIDLVLSALRTWSEAGFAREMIDCGLVIGVHDEMGSVGYAPADRADLRLVDRVASLFVADYLTRPGDYEALITCASCAVPSFHWDRMHAPGCEAEAPPSGMYLKRREQPTCAGVGVGVEVDVA